MQARFEQGAPPLIWAITGLFVVIELAFWVAESGVADLGPLRARAYVNFAFFDLLFEAALAGEAVPETFWATFFSHAFLHGGAVHLVMNSVIFLALGGHIARVLGNVRFLMLFAATAAGGALTYGLIAAPASPVPMVGASGVLFGLFGAAKAWEWRWIRATGASARRFWGTIAALILMNVLLIVGFLFEEGGIAWEAHLGGFVAGFLIAPFLAPGRAGPSPI